MELEHFTKRNYFLFPLLMWEIDFMRHFSLENSTRPSRPFDEILIM